MKGGFILFNGKFHHENEPIFTGLDIERLSSSIKASFRAENNHILFADENYSYLNDSMSELGIAMPNDWNLPRFRKDVSRLLNKNHLFLAARINIHFFKGSEHTDYFIRAEEISRGFYPLNEPGLLIDFYEEGKKQNSRFSPYECSSRYLWITASMTTLTKSKNNLLISNSGEFICEAIAASFGYIKENLIIFPSRDSNGFYPPLIGVIIKCAKKCGFKIMTLNKISREDLLTADEMFLVDNTLGIQKVLGLNSRRYYSAKTTILAAKLKEAAMEHAANLV